MAGSLQDAPKIYIDIQKLINQGEVDEAIAVANELINDNPKDWTALFMAAQIMNMAGKKGLAYNLYQQVVYYNPKCAEAWNNMGGTLKDLHWRDEAIRHFNKSIKLDPHSAHPYNNIGVLLVEDKQPLEALKYCDKAIQLDPKDPFNFQTRAFARLMLNDWGGYDDYDACLDTGTRMERAYGKEPRWNGEKNKTVVIHREQGLGDEIMFAQSIPKAIEDCKKVILDVDPRLVGLFKRSFPKAEVYGTGHLTKGIEWLDRIKPDYHCAIGSLFRIYKDPEPERYLIPEPERVNAFKTLLSKDKPNIGISWSGGKKNTGLSRRTLKPEDFKSILKLDANFLSVDYLPYDGDIKHWSWLVEKGVDYDNTAALIENLDLVISVANSTVHLAGALGKECWALTPEKCNWRFLEEGSTMPYHNSLKLYRQNGSWQNIIKEVERDLHEYIKSFRRV